MTTDLETVETAAWTNRELMLRTYHQVVEINGTVRDHDREIYGSPDHGSVGLKQTTTENTSYLVRLRTVLKVAGTVAGCCLAILTTILVLVVEHVL